MSRKYKFRDQTMPYFISYSIDYWIDLFIRNEYKDIVLDSWRHCIKEKGLEVYSWCIMTSHIHMIIGSQGKPLDKIVGAMKKHTSMHLKEAIRIHQQESRKEWILWMMKRAGQQNSNNQNFQLWQQHNQPIELNTPEILQQKMDYIHNNPVVAGFVDTPEAYLYSSARDYAGEQGLLKELIFV